MRWKKLSLTTLDVYILKRFLSIYAANLVSFTSVFVLIDSVTHFDDFIREQEGLGEILRHWFQYYSAITPVIFCQILGPVVSVSAGLFAVTTLQRSNEFTPMLATGRSYQRTLLPVLIASFAVSCAIFLVQELWIPRTVDSIREALESREGPSKDSNVKHLDTANGNLLVLKEYERFARRAKGVLILPVARAKGHQYLIQAKSAEWRVPEVASAGSLKDYWLLRDGSIQEYDEEGNLVIQPPPTEWEGAYPALYKIFAERKLESNLFPEDIKLRREETVHMTLGELRRKAEISPDQNVWVIKYLSRFVYALTNFILVLLGLPVIVHFGNRNILFGAILAVIISTLYFVVNSVFQDFGIQGHISPRLGAGMGPLLFTALGATLYRGMRS